MEDIDGLEDNIKEHYYSNQQIQEQRQKSKHEQVFVSATL